MPALPSADSFRAGSFASLLFVYTVFALTVSGVHYTETLNRVTTERIFDESVFGSSLADSLAAIGFMLLFFSASIRSKAAYAVCMAVFGVALSAFLVNLFQLVIAGLVTLPLLAGLLITASLRSQKTNWADRSRFLTKIRTDGAKIATAFLVIIIIMEIGALARWVSFPVFPTEIYSDASWRIAELESALFHSLGLLSPIFVALIAFSFLYRWYIPDLRRLCLSILRGRATRSCSTTQERIPDSNKIRKIDPKPITEDGGRGSPLLVKQLSVTHPRAKVLPIVILSSALISAPLLVVYSHLPILSLGGGISTDEQYYLDWATKLRANEHLSGVQVVADAFTINNGDRPLTLLLIIGIANLIAVPDIMIIRFLPVALAPALVTSSYLLVRYTLSSKKAESIRMFAALAALVTAFSPQIVVGEYAGLLANWLGLVTGYFSLVFMIKSWGSNDKRQFVLYSVTLFAVLLLVMLIHLYTWSHLLVVTLVFCGLSCILSRKNTTAVRTKVLVTMLIVGACLAVDYTRSLYFDTPPLAGSESALVRNIQQQESRWDQLRFTLGTYVGGFLSNPLLLILALTWVAAKGDLAKGLDRVLISMVFIVALPILVGTIEFQTRVLYNTPIQISAILALNSLNGPGKSSVWRVILMVVIIAVTATFAVRAMANLPLELPEGFELNKQFLLP